MRCSIWKIAKRSTFLALALAVVPAKWSMGATASVSFQNGINGYLGTFDRKIDERGNSGPAGVTEFDGSTRTEYFLDGYNASNASPDSQALIRFDNIIGNGPGQIPPNATILDAKLQVITSTSGNAQSAGPWGIAQLLQPFDSNTTYFGSFNCGGCALGSRGAWWEDGYTNRPVAAYGGKWQGDPAVASIRSIVQRWANGNANHGIVIQTGNPAGTDDGWGIISTGHPIAERRPKLSVTYTTDPIVSTTFQRGLNGYSGDTMAWVRSGNNIFGVTGANPEPDARRDDITYDGATGAFAVAPNTSITNPTALTSFQVFLDGPQWPATDTTGTANSPDDLALIHFGGVFGSGSNQAPSNVPVARAWLGITTGNTSNAAPSNGEWSVHRMLRPWSTSTLYSEFGSQPGLQVVDGDITDAVDRQIGIIYGSQVWFDVTSYLEGVRTGAFTDYGLAILSTATADGWQIHLNGSTDPEFRPQLVVLSGNVNVVAPGLAGDYNDNGVVDAADYALWRKHLNQSVTLPNDTTPGTVTAADYDVWKANFGRTPGGPQGASLATAVPEPATWLLGLCGALLALRRGNRL